ncbi:MAG: TlpA disulfide reductase family protein [Planctomycetota bacterium]
MNFKCAAAAAACVLAWSLTSQSHAEEPKPAPIDKTAPATTPDKAPVAVAKPDRYKLPENADSKTLVEFCKKLQTLQPASQEEANEMQAKVPTALKQACAKILELEKGDGTADGRFAKRFELIFKFQDAGGPGTPDGKKALEELIAFATDAKFTVEDIQLAHEIGGMLQSVDPKRATTFYAAATKTFATCKDPAATEILEDMAGSMRRMNLVGNTMELKGTTVQGKPFDITSLKGKVVLVDFWATWCGYCVKEIPNVKRNYAGYKNKGFEVVAVSADQDRPALDAFLAESKIEWINLHDKDGSNPALKMYGINGFPTTFLIGKDGNVVSLSARGKELDEALLKLLGEPEAPKELPKAAPEKADPLKDAIKEALKDVK